MSGESLWLAPAWNDEAHRTWLRSLPHSDDHAERSILHEGRNRVWRQRHGDDDIVVKCFGVGNFWKRLLAPLRQPKALRTAQIAQRILAAGIATPEPLAAIESEHGAILVTRYVAHHGCAADLHDAQHPHRDQRLHALGTFLARCRHAGVRHRDCNGGNILVRSWDDPALILIDTNRVSFGSRALLPWLWTMLRLGFHDRDSAQALLTGFGCAGHLGGYLLLARMQRSWWWARSITRPWRRRMGS